MASRPISRKWLKAIEPRALRADVYRECVQMPLPRMFDRSHSMTRKSAVPSSSRMPPVELLRPRGLREPLSATVTRRISTERARLTSTAKPAILRQRRRSMARPVTPSAKTPLARVNSAKEVLEGGRPARISSAARLPSIEKSRRVTLSPRTTIAARPLKSGARWRTVPEGAPRSSLSASTAISE